MIFKDYYKILEIENNASIDDIKIAFREQAKKYHPDLNQENQGSEERFKDINEAYNILVDPVKRRKYDRNWRNVYRRTTRSNEKASDEIFSILFGSKTGNGKVNKKKTNKKITAFNGENIETSITISMTEAYFGCQKELVFKNINSVKKYTINIPANIENGGKIKILGQGKKGINGGKDGDLLINVLIEEEGFIFKDKKDIIEEIPITPWEAIFGGQIEVNAIDENINVLIPPGSESGDEINIPNKGYKVGEERGNLTIRLKIVVPRKLSEEEKVKFKELQSISKFNPRS